MQAAIHMQSTWHPRGVRGHVPPGNFDILSSIRRNLVESGTVSYKHNKVFVKIYKKKKNRSGWG